MNQGSDTIRFARPRCGGFSMIELIVVLVLLGMTSALAAVSLRGTKHVVDSALLQQQLVDFDQRVRQRAQMSGGLRTVSLDLDRQTMTETGGGDAFTAPLRWAAEAPHARVVAVWTPTRGWVRRGQAAWSCSPDAVTPTYALELASGAEGGRDEGERWLVAGASGQWSRLDGLGDLVLDTLRAASDG